MASVDQSQSVVSGSQSQLLGGDEPNWNTLEHHQDVTVDEPRRALLEKEAYAFSTKIATELQGIFEAVHFRTIAGAKIESSFVDKKSHKEKLQGLQREISSQTTQLKELSGLTNVIPDGKEVITAKQDCDAVSATVFMLDAATTQLLKLVQEKEYRDALKLWDKIAAACGKVGEKSKSVDELDTLSQEASKAIESGINASSQLDPFLQHSKKRVYRDTLDMLKQLHATVKSNGGPQGKLDTLEASLNTTAAKITGLFASYVRQVPQAPMTDQEIATYGQAVILAGTIKFNEGYYAYTWGKTYKTTVDFGKALDEKAKAILQLERDVLASVDDAARGKLVDDATRAKFDRLVCTLHSNIETARTDLLKTDANHVVKYVLDYAAGLESLLERIQSNLHQLEKLQLANCAAMQKVQAAVSAVLQPAPVAAAPIELLYGAAVARNEAKAAMEGQADDFVKQMMRAKIAAFHEMLAAKKDAVLQSTPDEDEVCWRLSGLEAITTKEGKLEDVVRTAIEKRLVSFLYWPENVRVARDIQESRRQKKFELQFHLELDLYLLQTKYEAIYKQALTDHPQFKSMIDAFVAKVGKTKIDARQLGAIADIEHLLYRASFEERPQIVAYARAWNRFTKLNLAPDSDIRRVLVARLQEMAQGYEYIPVSKEYEDKKTSVMARNIKLLVDSVKVEDKQSSFFRALASAIDDAVDSSEYAEAQKIVSAFIESDGFSECIKGHEESFETLIFENTKAKILSQRMGDVTEKEKELFVEGPVQEYLDAYDLHSEQVAMLAGIKAKNLKDIKQKDIDDLALAVEQAKPLFTDHLMERVVFRLAMQDEDFAELVKESKFQGSEDEYKEWYELMVYDMKARK